MTPRRQSPFRRAFAASAVLHAGLGALFWMANGSAAEVPTMRVYSVNIVSPPPRELGEWSPAPSGDPEVAEAPDAAEPGPEPDPEPPPVPKEPSPAPKATTNAEAPKTPPATPVAKTPTPKAPVTKAAGNSGTSTRSTGANPDASSVGGEGLDVRSEGARFVEPGYLENIVRQLNRYFRRPAGSVTDEAEIQFWINRDGSVSDIQVLSSKGSFRFRTAAMEAVEQAGLRKAFGALPAAYPADRLPVSFYFRPAR